MKSNKHSITIVFFSLFLSFFGNAQNNGENIKPDEEVFSPEQLQIMAEIKSVIQENNKNFLESLSKEQKSRYDEIQKLKASGVSYKVIGKANTAFMNSLTDAQRKSREAGAEKREALKATFRASLNEEQKEHVRLKKKMLFSKLKIN